jgi:hypothetical protein
MTSELAVADEDRAPHRFAASLEAELSVERDLMLAVFRGIAVAVPVGIVVFIGLLAVAIGDQTAWYVWVGLGVGSGMLGGTLFGVLAGVTLMAPKLDIVDQHVDGT